MMWTAARTTAVTTALGVLIVVVGGVGVATAANGGSFVLGKANTASRTTELKDSKGTPLALVGKASKPPLTVNSSKQVGHLNASLLDGLSASGLATQGSGASDTRHPDGVPLSSSLTAETLVASTGTLAAGTYFISGSTESDDFGSGSVNGVFCYIGTGPAISDAMVNSGSMTNGTSTQTATLVVTLKTPTKLGYYCSSFDLNTDLENGGMFAIKIAHPAAGTAGF